MCPRTAPISRVGKAAASAAARMLRAFEAELAPVVEAISPGAMGAATSPPRWDAAARARAAAVVERARARGLEISKSSSSSMRTSSWWSPEEDQYRWGPPETGKGSESSGGGGGGGAAAA